MRRITATEKILLSEINVRMQIQMQEDVGYTLKDINYLKRHGFIEVFEDKEGNANYLLTSKGEQTIKHYGLDKYEYINTVYCLNCGKTYDQKGVVKTDKRSLQTNGYTLKLKTIDNKGNTWLYWERSSYPIRCKHCE